MHAVLATSAALGILFGSSLHSVRAAGLTLANEYTGSTFFDGWTFQNGIDANTTGNVLFQTREQAKQENLTFVNSAGNVIIKVDNTTDGTKDPTFGRPSVKILSNATVPAGSLVIMDAVHMPYGCSVWPAFWMQGPNWPNDGEIDIVENVNLATNNRYVLHTLNGCQHPSADASMGQETGTVISTDCFNQTNGDEGCIVQDNSSNSFGAGFASNGGGAFAMLWNDDGIKIWFFPRQNIPSDLGTKTPNPSSWPTPTAFYPSSSCNTPKFFSPQTLIIDTTICGNFAGAPNVFNPSCSGVCTDLVGIPSNYDNAYFEIKYIRVFTNGSSTNGQSAAGNAGGSSSSSNHSNAAETSIIGFTTQSSIIALILASALSFVAAFMSFA